jgi:positive regulator of sigma E activity
MQQRGIVVAKSNDQATVRIGRCVGCKGERSCPFSLEIGGKKQHEIEIQAANPLDAPIGTFVHVETEAGQIMQGIFIVYVLPLFLLLAGMGLGHILVPQLSWGEVMPLLAGGGLGLVLWFLIIRRFNANFQENYRIVEVEQLSCS